MERQLVYSPDSPLFKKLMEKVEKTLKFTKSIGVNSTEDMANILFSKNLLAGIEFYHSLVRLMSFLIYSFMNCTEYFHEFRFE